MKICHAVIISLLLFSASPVSADNCGNIDFIKNIEKYNDVEIRDYYFDPLHNFFVTLPDGVVGRTDSGPFASHGFGAVLSKEDGGAYLTVLGDYGAWMDDDESPRSLDKVVRQHTVWLKEKQTEILKQKRLPTLLGGLSATLLHISYRCKELPYLFLQDRIFALSTDSSDLYEISLYATEKNYAPAKGVMDAVAKSWRLKKPEISYTPKK